MQSNDFWTNVHKMGYKNADWIDKPSLFVSQVVDLLPKEGKLLDLGAGQGQDSRFFARAGYKVISTDLNEAALSLSKAKADDDVSDLEFKVVDIGKKFSFDDQSYDVVYSHLGLHYFDKQTTRGVLEEIKRVLKPGGVLAFLANTIEDPEIKEEGFVRIEDHFYKEQETGLFKAYFTVGFVEELIEGLFEPILLDAEGETYKDGIKTLIRFVGRRIK